MRRRCGCFVAALVAACVAELAARFPDGFFCGAPAMANNAIM